jgi:hypothetical protein
MEKSLTVNTLAKDASSCPVHITFYFSDAKGGQRLKAVDGVLRSLSLIKLVRWMDDHPLHSYVKQGKHDFWHTRIPSIERMEAPVMHWYGFEFDIDDGRHRIRALLDRGAERVGVFIPEDCVQKFDATFG